MASGACRQLQARRVFSQANPYPEVEKIFGVGIG
jgi:hypothetical protein